MKQISLILSIVVLTFATGCKQSSEKETISVTLPQNKSITTIDISDNQTSSELAFREWELPQRLKKEWVNAKEIKHIDTLRFDQIKEVILIDYTVLSKDTSNFIFKKIKITAPNPNKVYSISGVVSEQLNHGSKSAFDMFLTVTLQATSKPVNNEGKQIFGQAYLILAKKGIIKPL